MGFTTKPAMEIKIAFINEFNRMEAIINEKNKVDHLQVRELETKVAMLEDEIRNRDHCTRLGYIAERLSKDDKMTEFVSDVLWFYDKEKTAQKK